MASRSTLIALLVVVSSVAAASAVTFTVGDTSGWTLGSVSYTTWVSGKTFAAGDELVFNFVTGAHDVVEVDKSGYDGCSTSNAANTTQNGPATVTLTSGTHYYICGFTGHCSAGMKLAVTVGSGSSPSTPPTPGTGGSPSPPSTPTTPSAPAPGTGTGTPGSASVRLTAGPALAVAAAVLVKLALF
ncbi:chemocyanin-like [Miscanthus floridulus]|uniref:chemocyanin-like n=1 Tax=Miscanthus floridulus TaxID=154761 RepID=UPI0034596F35